MNPTYQEQTINAKNPIARFAHRNRVAKSVQIARGILGAQGTVLDYGCGDGTFVNAMSAAGYGAFGYEPYMTGPAFSAIHRDFDELLKLKIKFDLITIFETIEHLSDQEIVELLSRAQQALGAAGELLFSAPIEIGPALVPKSLNREWRCGRSGVAILTGSLLLAAIFGRAELRASDLKISHKGYDFRESIKFLKKQGCAVTILAYGPLPIGIWYGNSQVYFSVRLAKQR